MRRKIRNWASAGLIMLCLGACSSNGGKTVYVNLNTLFEKFPLKKQLETKLENTKNVRKAILDSMTLSFKYKVSDAELKADKDERQKLLLEQRSLVEKKNLFEEDNARISQQYNDQIWKQINQYVRDYGEEKGYDFILGAEGSGTVMYASKAFDVTEEAGEYINKRYNGSKKGNEK